MRTIVYIGGELPDKDASALRIIANAKALRDYGFNIVLIGQSREIVETEKCVICGFDAYLMPFPISTKEWISDLFSISPYLEIINKYNNVCTIICYNFHAISLYRLMRYGRRNDIPIIADCTEWHTVSHLKGVKKLIKWFDVLLRIKVVQYKLSGIIAISNYFRNLYKDCNCIVVPPLVDKSEEKWIANSISDPSDQVVFVYAGKMGIGKDQLNDCLAVLYKHKEMDYLLNVVGIDEAEYLKQYPTDERIIKELGRKIVFHGRVPHKTAVDFVKNSDFSILVREHNRKNDSGFPTKFPESIACGTPVVSSSFSDVKEFIVENSLGFVTDDISQIENVFCEALNTSPSKRSEMKKTCRDCKVFDYHTYIDRLGDFIESIIGECNGQI